MLNDPLPWIVSVETLRHIAETKSSYDICGRITTCKTIIENKQISVIYRIQMIIFFKMLTDELKWF